MLACIVIPSFDLRAALRSRPALALKPCALAPLPGTEPRIGAVTAAADEAGVAPGMRLGEALATCPDLVLVEQDPASVEHEWEGVVRRLEDAGFSVEPARAGCAYFETRGVERLYGGIDAALKRALAAIGPAWDPRAGVSQRRFAALAAASVARPGQILVVSGDRTPDFLAPLPLTLLPLEQPRREELQQLGVRTLGQLAGLPGAAVAERMGPDGRRAWSLARGRGRAAVEPRRPPSELAETFEFPEAVANELTLRRALASLVDRVLARPERGGREPRKLAVSARLVAGGSWRRTLTLREPTADPERLRIALAPKLAEVPAPVVKLRLELVELGTPGGRQLELVPAEGGAQRRRLRDGVRQARASAGAGAVCSVVEVAPWSRIPEQRALLVPAD